MYLPMNYVVVISEGRRGRILSIIQYLLESTLAGALVGTSVAGLITVSVFKRQIGYDRDTRKIEELQKYLKLNSLFESHLKANVEQLSLLQIAIANDDNKVGTFTESTKRKSQHVFELIEDTILNSERFKFIDLPYEIYYEYIGATELLKSIRTDTIFDSIKAEVFKTDWLAMQPDKFGTDILRLKVTVRNIEEFRIKADEDLQVLKSKWNK